MGFNFNLKCFMCVNGWLTGSCGRLDTAIRGRQTFMTKTPTGLGIIAIDADEPMTATVPA